MIEDLYFLKITKNNENPFIIAPSVKRHLKQVAYRLDIGLLKLKT